MATPLPRWRHWRVFAVVFCSISSMGAGGDPSEYRYRISSHEVRLNFSVMDQNNHGVATLQANDFAVVDRDVIVRNFQSFTRSDWTKLEIGILVDTSESVTPRFRQEMAEVVNLVSETAGVPEENLSMFSFAGTHPVLLCAGDCRALGGAEQPAAERSRGLTPLFDTIVFAADYLEQHGEAHAEKVLIVFSDGADTISRNSLGESIGAALKSEVQLDCIDLNKTAASSQGAATLHQLASATGGRYFPPPDGAAHALNVILDGFRASYSVSYRLPSHTSGFHSIRILPTHNLNLQFRSRSGYYYPDQVR